MEITGNNASLFQPGNMKMKHPKHFKPAKGWTLIQWARQCWKSNPASKRAGVNKQEYIMAAALRFRGEGK